MNLMNNPSICIPRLNKNIDKWNIDEIFKKLNIGKIDKIDLLFNSKTQSKKAFIHFKYWYNNEKNNRIKNILNENKHFNIVYEFPDFWKCYKSNCIRKN